MRELAREQIENAMQATEKATEELRIMLLPTDPNDDKNVIIEIRAVPEARKPPSLPGCFTVCITCMP